MHNSYYLLCVPINIRSPIFPLCCPKWFSLKDELWAPDIYQILLLATAVNKGVNKNSQVSCFTDLPAGRVIDNKWTNNSDNSRWLYLRSIKQTEKDHGVMDGEWLNTIERVIFLKVVLNWDLNIENEIAMCWYGQSMFQANSQVVRQDKVFVWSARKYPWMFSK